MSEEKKGTRDEQEEPECLCEENDVKEVVLIQDSDFPDSLINLLTNQPVN